MYAGGIVGYVAVLEKDKKEIKYCINIGKIECFRSVEIALLEQEGEQDGRQNNALIFLWQGSRAIFIL